MYIQTEKTFSAAHFVQTAGEDSPCFRLHGHDFRAIIEVEGNLKPDGMVIDFRKIKNIIDELDHKVLIPDIALTEHTYAEITDIKKDEDYLEISFHNKFYMFPKSDIFIMEGIKVVTSENISSYLSDKLSSMFPYDKFTVTVYEGSTSYAKI